MGDLPLVKNLRGGLGSRLESGPLSPHESFTNVLLIYYFFYLVLTSIKLSIIRFHRL